MTKYRDKIYNATRQLIRSSTRGYLSTHFEPSTFKTKKIESEVSFPYSTFTLTAFDYDLSPILLLSNLSEHTSNIKNNPMVSLMLCEENKMYKFFPKFKGGGSDYEDPMSRPRITLIGKLKISKNKNHKKRFLSRHPASNLYSEFSDMNIFKLDILGAHLVGGFASVKWFKNKDLLCEKFDNFEESEYEIVSHMNSCHNESLDLYVNKLIKPFPRLKDKWKLIGIDPDGFDLRRQGNLTRFAFENQINDAKKLRGIFVSLHKTASKL